MALVTFILLGSLTWAADLEILFPDVKIEKGGMAVAIFPKSEAKGFPDGAGYIRKVYKKPDGHSPFKIDILDLAEGEYALSAFQDEDGDEMLARDWLGIPSEPFGFSNNPRIYFGAPSFRRSSFSVLPGKNQISVKVKVF